MLDAHIVDVEREARVSAQILELERAIASWKAKLSNPWFARAFRPLISKHIRNLEARLQKERAKEGG